MNHAEALQYLDRHINLEKTGATAGRVDGLTLEPMARLMHVLGDPQSTYPVIHITGTNGKGSTARMIADLLAAHGLRVGLYTSPHLQAVNERLWFSGDPLLRVDADGELFEAVSTRGPAVTHEDREDVVSDAELIGLDEEDVALKLSEEWNRSRLVEAPAGRPAGPITDEELAQVISEVAELEPLAGITPSYFELLTAAALTWFAHLPVDVAVVEVGLLGRYDATNVVDAVVAVVTNIGQDHTDFQGDWRAAIAQEKAGIVKPGSFLVLGETDADLRPVFEAAVDHDANRMWVIGEDVEALRNQVAVGGRLLDVRTPGGLLEEVFVPAHGEHQGTNAVIAIAAVEAFFARPLEAEVAQAGFMRTHLRARFDVVGRAPLVVVDGAHNPDGAATVLETLNEDFDITGRRILVIGMLDGRDPEQFLDAVGARNADLVIACSPPSPRALPAEELGRVAAGMGVPTETVADVADAIERARAVAAEEDVIIVTGSLYTAGAALDVLAR